MSLYTRFGDTGDTMLYGGGTARKDDARMHAVGTVDELSAAIGVVLSFHQRCHRKESGQKSVLRRSSGELVRDQLLTVQKMLHTAGADLAAPFDQPGHILRITQAQVEELERWIDDLESATLALRHFILPGGSQTGALLHIARTTCRRAERWIVALRHREPINEAALRFFNRLSDYLFALARAVNVEEGVEEEIV